MTCARRALEKATEELESVGSKLLSATRPETRESVKQKYDELSSQVKRRREFYKKDSHHSLTHDDLSAEVGKLELAFSSGVISEENVVPDELKTLIRDVHADLELSDRLLSLSQGAPKDKRRAEAALRWLSQKDETQFLDFLFENTDYLTRSYDSDVVELLTVAKEGIIGKAFQESLAFYACSESQMLQAIEQTIQRSKAIQPSTLKDCFKAESPTAVLEYLKEMQGILEEYVEAAEVRRWLESRNKLFADHSPRTAILTGYTFKVYQFLIGLAHGVHS